MTDIENALEHGVVPWNEIEYRTLSYWAFKSHEPLCENHIVFAPITKNMTSLMDCYRAAYSMGFSGHVSGKWPKYRIVQTVGNKDIDYPFVELIPKYQEN